MDSQLLRTFVAIARSGSVTRATRSLHLTQPAVSGQLRLLEEQLNVKLFDRTPQGMQLTSDGESLLPVAQHVLDAEAELLAAAGRLTDAVAGRVRLGISSSPAHLRLGELYESVARAYPALVIEVHHSTSGAVLTDVLQGKLEIGFVVGARSSNDTLAELRLKPLVVYVAAPAKWREEIQAQGWDSVIAKPWVVGAADSFCGQAARSWAKSAARLIEVDHPRAVLELVTAGVCAGVLHEEEALAAEAAGHVVLWKERPVVTELRAVWDAGRSPANARAAVISTLQRIWAPE